MPASLAAQADHAPVPRHLALPRALAYLDTNRRRDQASPAPDTDAMKLHADLTQRAVVFAEDQPWRDSPLPGVQRRMLERDGEEVARATTIVRFAPDSHFSAHTHGGGEEFLVLDGVFSDEDGDFGPGSYVRNPPGSRHTPRSQPGCTIFVKLCQMDPDDRAKVRIDTTRAAWQPGPVEGVSTMPLYQRAAERVALVRLAPGTRLGRHGHPGGEEIFVLEGTLADEAGRYPKGSWLRNPAGSEHAPYSDDGCLLYIKTGHLGASALS
jgi:anti-sigma factor ChrR (cupin superfamily)